MFLTSSHSLVSELNIGWGFLLLGVTMTGNSFVITVFLRMIYIYSVGSLVILLGISVGSLGISAEPLTEYVVPETKSDIS